MIEGIVALLALYAAVATVGWWRAHAAAIYLGAQLDALRRTHEEVAAQLTQLRKPRKLRSDLASVPSRPRKGKP